MAAARGLSRLVSVLSLLLLGGLLASCVSTQDAFVRDLRSKPAQYASLAALPYAPIQIGENRLDVVEDLDIGRFPWGKSRFLALELPKADRPYYLVVKSYMVSPVTHFHYNYVRGEGLDEPWVFFPRLTILDEDLAVIGQSGVEDFQVNSNIRLNLLLNKAAGLSVIPFAMDTLRAFLISTGSAGESWLQAAFRIDPATTPTPRFAIVSTSSAFVGKVGAVPEPYWPFSREMWPVFAVGDVPQLGPMSSYRGTMHTLHYANIGELQVQAVYPRDLLRTTYGKKMKPPVERVPVEPGAVYEKRGLRVHAPAAPGYAFEDRSSGGAVYFIFSKDLPSGRGNVTLFAQLYRPGLMYIDNFDTMIEFVLKRYEFFLVDVKTHVQDIKLFGKNCKRIDFTGRQRNMYLGSFRGYDIHCIVRKDKSSPLAVRIGGNLVTNPAFPAPGRLPEESEAFIAGISFH